MIELKAQYSPLYHQKVVKERAKANELAKMVAEARQEAKVFVKRNMLREAVEATKNAKKRPLLD